MYSKQQLKEKLEKRGISFHADIPCGDFAGYKLDPVFEDENGEKYYDDYVLNLLSEKLVKKVPVPVEQENIESYTGLNTFMSDFKKTVEMFLNELKECNLRAVEAERKLFLLEDNEKRIKEEYFELNSEVKRLNCELEDKDRKLNELEDYKKKLNSIEIQLKLMQIKQNKKKLWEFWK